MGQGKILALNLFVWFIFITFAFINSKKYKVWLTTIII